MADRPRPRRPSKATHHTTVHLPPVLLAEVNALANGGSRNAVLVALIEEGLRSGIEHQHATLLEAAVARAVAQALERIGDLVFRAALDSDETRRLVIALLVRELGAEPARALRREAHSASWERLKEPVAEQPERSGAWPAAPTRS